MADGNLDFLCLNGAANARKVAALSGNRVIPAHVSALPGLILSGRIKVDVALIRVRPTHDPNVFSLGVMVDFVHEMVDAARVVVAEIDERMPLTGDDALIERDRITHLTMADGPDPLIFDPKPSADRRRGRRAGRGADPGPGHGAVRGWRPARCGLRGAREPQGPGAAQRGHPRRGGGPDRGRCHRQPAQGDRRRGERHRRSLRDAAADELRRPATRRSRCAAPPTRTPPARSLQIENLHSINSAIEIDLTGQVNAEMAGRRYVGAVGGQIDYVRGGRLSQGGRSIIAMSSATPDGKHSKIVARPRRRSR